MDLIERAVQVLHRDGIIVYPTDTVYGLGADALSEDAVIRVYEVKNRPISKPISVAVSDREMLSAIAVVDSRADAFMDRFLPGPVTVVLKAKSCLPEILTGGTGMIGVRIPAHPIALGIISRFDGPITATSANYSGEQDPVTVSEVHVQSDLVIDGGKLPGTPSTVVDLTAWQIIRPGERCDDVASYLVSCG
jgi:L-threonylcarbamoyladenylate synthase